MPHSRLLLFAGAFLFVLAVFCAAGIIPGISAWAFGFGGFAAWVLAYAVK